MSILVGLNVPGVVGAVRRRVGLHLETLLLCDAPHGDCAVLKGRGFYKLLCASKGQLPVLGPRLTVYETDSKGSGLRPYEFSSFLSCAAFCAGSGLTFFGQGHEIYILDANNVIRRLISDHDGVGRVNEPKLYYPSALAVPDPETLYVTDANGLHVFRLAPSSTEDGVIVVSASTMRFHNEDQFTQFGLVCGSCGNVMFSARAIYRASGPGVGWQLWAGNAELGGDADGVRHEARFSSITAVALDGTGAALVLDAQPDGRTVVRRISVDGHVKTIYRPTPLEEIDACGDAVSCDSRSMSPCSAGPACGGNAATALEPYECAFLGGGLRCPLVLDNFLVLCAPLQGFILFLRVSGLRELPFEHAESRTARTCSNASCSTFAPAPACLSSDVAWCNYGAHRVGPCADPGAHAESSSCSSSSSGCNSGYDIYRANSCRNGGCASLVYRDDLHDSCSAAVIELVQLQQDEEEVSSEDSSHGGKAGDLGQHLSKRKGSVPNCGRVWAGKTLPARKRCRRL